MLRLELRFSVMLMHCGLEVYACELHAAGASTFALKSTRSTMLERAELWQSWQCSSGVEWSFMDASFTLQGGFQDPPCTEAVERDRLNLLQLLRLGGHRTHP